MKIKRFFSIIAIYLLAMVSACAGRNSTSNKKTSNGDVKMTQKLLVTANGTTWTAELADNSSAKALAELIQKNGSITVNASDYGGFEKVGSLPESLPTNDEQITTGPGDLILYLGKSFVLYYDTNAWNFTRLGRINNVTKEELLKVLGTGNVEITLTLGE